MSKPTNSLAIAEGPDLNAKDYEVLLRALDALDGLMQTELANKGQDAAAGETRSRILIVRGKLRVMQGGSRNAISQIAEAERTEQSERCEQLKAGVEEEIGRLHKTNALLIATQFAANHECEFDASDAMAAIIERVEQTIETLDQLCTEAGHAQR